ncbi:hypothetical protein [Criblamydia sequanensis]|uniref:Conserved putative membrane protein n=1 Tax=Candidatus Criblamydia sequanensis CRIB-18 TaxID=1437425 RepID=A0A090CYR4_9BACT|nr:hypothetical protein [Criblamydia sequanensis]CDR33807.1 Conserved putative membrane protein [Criblamydia sequanensis CRIB-18]
MQAATTSALIPPVVNIDIEAQKPLNPEGPEAPEAPKTFSEKIKSLALKVWSFAKWFFNAVLNVVLFITNPTFYVVGFVAGIILIEKMKEAVQRITAVFEKQKLSFLIILGIGAFFSLPIALASTSFFFGSITGINLAEETPPPV